MSIDIPRPNITASTEAGRLEQVRSYLYQMAEQLNWALNNVERQMETVVAETSKQTSSEPTPEEAKTNFNSIKALIIKSADIVEAYSEVIEKKLEGKYVAESDFGTYKQDTSALITANSEAITAKFGNIQEIASTLEEIKSQLIETEAYIRAGYLEDDPLSGVPVYGIEVGQEDIIGDKDSYRRFARFTSDRLSFYNSNRDEIAYISGYNLTITNARIKSALYHGGYRIDSSDGLAYIWEGRDETWQ